VVASRRENRPASFAVGATSGIAGAMVMKTL